jgi:hypothetical protein
MIKSLENLPKRSLSQSADNLIAIGYRITRRNLGLAIIAGKISDGSNSPWTDIINFVFRDFFFLKLG